MEDEFIRVTDNSEDDFMELPVEKDGALLLSTLAAQYPGITGLRYKNDKSGAWRGIRLEDGKLYPPDTNAWGDRIYWAVFPKSDKKIEKTSSLTEKADEAKKCCDLIVLGLPWATDENSLRDYFATFGSLVFVQVKRDAFGKSKGFGFIRFSDSNAQTLCMAQKHNIDGRMCEVRIPYSKVISLPHGNGKIHVGRVTDDITSDDILAFFSQYGRVLEVFIPKPCRGFAFVTFADPDVAQKLIGEDLILKNTSIRISYANAQPWEHNNHTSNDNINNPNSNRNNFQPYPTASAYPGPKANSTPLNNLLPHNPFFIATRYPPPQHSSSKGITFPFGYYGNGHPSFPFHHHHQNNFPPYYHVNQNHGNTLLGSGKALIHTTNVPINNNTYSQHVISQSPLPSSSKMAGAFKTFTDTWKASTHIGSSTNISSTNYSWTTNSENPYNFNSFLDNLPSSFPTISTVVSSYGLTPHSYNMVNHLNPGQNDSNNHHNHPMNTNMMGPAHLSFFPTNPSALPGIGLAGVNNTHHPQNFSLINAPLQLQNIPGLSSQPYALLQNQHYPQILKHANSHNLINHNNFSVFNPYYGSSYHYTQMNHSMPNPTFFLANNNNCVEDTANVKPNHVFEHKLHTYQANGQQQVPIHFQNYSQYLLSYYSAIAAAYAMQHHNTNYKSFHNFAPLRQIHSNNAISDSKLETHDNYEESTKDRNTSSVIMSNLEYLDDTDHSVTPIKTINDTGLAESSGGPNLGDSDQSHVNYSPFHDHHTILNKPNIEVSFSHQLPFHFGIGHGGNVNGHHEMPYLQAYFQQALLLQNQMNQHRSLNVGENKLVHHFPLYPNQILSNQQQSISHQHHGGDNLNSHASLDNKSRAYHDNNFNQKSLASVITGTRSRNSSLCQNINDLRLKSLIEGDGESFFEGCGEHIYATNNNDSGFINGEATLNLDNNGLSHANLPDMTKNGRSSIDKNNLTLISSLTQHSKSSIYSISTANNNYGCSFNLDINSSNKNVSLLSGALCPIPSSAWDNVAELSEKPNDNNLQMSNFRSKNIDFSIALNQRNIHTKSLPRSRCNSSFSACSSTNIGFPLVSNYNNNNNNTNKLRHCTDGSITDLELEMLLLASNEHLNLINNNKNVGTDFNNNHIENGGISKGFNHQPFSHMIEEKRENAKLTEMLLESIHESRQKQNGSFTSNSDLDYFGGSISNLKHESLGSNFDVHDSDCHGNNSIRSFGTAASQQYLAGSPPNTVFVQNIIDTLLTTNEQSNVDKKSAEHYKPNEMVLIDEDAILLKDAISSSTTNIPNY